MHPIFRGSVLSLIFLPCLTLAATPIENIRFDESTSQAFDRSGQHLTQVQHPDGSLETQFNGSFQNVMVARLAPDGSIETYCTTDEQSAEVWMSRQADNSPEQVEFDTPPDNQP